MEAHRGNYQGSQQMTHGGAVPCQYFQTLEHRKEGYPPSHCHTPCSTLACNQASSQTPTSLLLAVVLHSVGCYLSSLH